MNSKTYLVPESSIETLQTRIAKLNKKLEKNGVPVVCVTIGDVYDKIDVDGIGIIQLFPVTIETEEPEVNGWKFVATLNHIIEGNEIQNVIMNVANRELPEMYRDRGPVCDHCGFNRKRRDTYVVHNSDTDQYVQVGRTCLRDFLGSISAEKIADQAAIIAEIAALAEEAAKTKGENIPLAQRSRWSLRAFLAHVSKEVKLHGFVSNKIASEQGRTPTSKIAFNDMITLNKALVEADLLAADNAIEYFSELSEQGLSEFQHNLRVIAKSRFVERKTIGFAAWIYQAFVSLKSGKTSQHVGVAGDKVVLTLTVGKIIGINGPYGHSFLHNTSDANGNEIIFFLKKEGLVPGQTYSIKGTVTKHGSYGNVAQTTLNHVSISK